MGARLHRLLLALLLLTAATASARCKGGLYVFPIPGSVVPTNTTFIIEGAGAESERVAKLAGRTDLILRSKSDEVTVSVGRREGIDFWKSGMNRVAVLLTLPRGRVLQPAQKYTLLIDQVLPGYTILNDTPTPTLSWTTGGGAKPSGDKPSKDPAEIAKISGVDKVPPRYQVKPAVEEGFYKKDGDALIRYLKMRVTLAEEAPSYFLVNMSRARGNAPPQKYPVPINGGEAILGHDACSGSFTFEDGRAYKLQVETFDAAGNKATEPLKTIEVQAPRPPL